MQVLAGSTVRLQMHLSAESGKGTIRGQLVLLPWQLHQAPQVVPAAIAVGARQHMLLHKFEL